MIDRLEQVLLKRGTVEPVAEGIGEGLVESAVLVPLLRQENEYSLLLTQRSLTVATHKGQHCFPGGVRDSGDETLWDTAVRECFEEIGVLPGQVRCLGRMSSVVTPTGFYIQPYLGWIANPGKMAINHDEIALVYTVPVTHLLEDQTQVVERDFYSGLVFRYQGHEIWGATSRIISNFLDTWCRAGDTLPLLPSTHSTK